MFRRPSATYALGLAAVLGLLPGVSLDAAPTSGDGPTVATADGVTKTDNVTKVGGVEFLGGSEVDFDGDRYLFAGQANLTDELRRQPVSEGDGGLHIIDLEADGGPAQVGFLDCPGTDNYVRYLDPAVFNTAAGDREYVAMAHHGNRCTAELLADDPNTQPGHGALNGVAIVDVTDKTEPFIASVIGADSAHTVMPHPIEPYLYVLPGGLANGTNVPNQRVSPTAIIDVSDPQEPEFVTAYMHNAQGCHDLGFSHDGEHAFCAGLGEVQVWDIAGERIEDPQVVGTIVNPAIQFAHNAVVSPSGRYLAINDEAFGFHTCSGEAADLYGSLWIYDITVPEVPVLAGRIAPPEHPGDQGFGTLDDVGPVNGWADSWCAAHNYNWVPGTDDFIVASWFGGGTTAHDMSDPLNPELVALYQPHDGVAWSGHYYGGFMVTNDMVRGVEILDVPELREAEEAARDDASDPGDGPPEGRPGNRPDDPGNRPDDPGNRPDDPGNRPDDPGNRPDDAGNRPDERPGARSDRGASTGPSATAMLPVDRSAELLPDVLPPRPVPERDVTTSWFCAIPGPADA